MKKKLILVSGANGQLGNELRVLSAKDKSFKWIFADVEQFDITKKKIVENVISSLKPDIFINCAAYTAVDKAESDSKLAFDVNSKAPKYLASELKKISSLLIHVSTDYVFDGKSNTPLKTDLKTKPQSVYGESKEKGEKNIINEDGNYLIVRTSWLYSSYGNNFVKTILRLSKEREELKVIADQIGCPTYAADLAYALYIMALKYTDEQKVQEIFHFSNSGVASWYDFAIAINEFAKNNCKIIPIETFEYPTPAKRPAYSVLNLSKYSQTFNVEIPYWRHSLKKCINLIKQNQELD